MSSQPQKRPVVGEYSVVSCGTFTPPVVSKRRSKPWALSTLPPLAALFRPGLVSSNQRGSVLSAAVPDNARAEARNRRRKE
jgi:hypothetical protein